MLLWLTMSFVDINTNKTEYMVYNTTTRYQSLAECRKDNSEELVDGGDNFTTLRSKAGTPVKVVFGCTDKLAD